MCLILFILLTYEMSEMESFPNANYTLVEKLLKPKKLVFLNL